jgi:hypothetical protein
MTYEDPVRATAHGASRYRNVPMGGHTSGKIALIP